MFLKSFKGVKVKTVPFLNVTLAIKVDNLVRNAPRRKPRRFPEPLMPVKHTPQSIRHVLPPAIPSETQSPHKPTQLGFAKPRWGETHYDVACTIFAFTVESWAITASVVHTKPGGRPIQPVGWVLNTSLSPTEIHYFRETICIVKSSIEIKVTSSVFV